MASKKTEIENMTLEEIKALAEQKVKKEIWEWINGGTETEFTLQRNRLALEKIMLRLRVINGINTADTSLTILGQTVKTPLIVAPFAFMGRVHPEAEIALSKGAEKAGAMMFLGSSSTASIKQVVGVAGTPVAWTSEPLKDREKLFAQIQQAETDGCCAVGLCADDFMGIKIKDRLKPLPNMPLTTEVIRAIRQVTTLPLFIKGIMTVEDALMAVDAGADAIVVSNHGGRVLDCCQASVEVLPEIVEAVDSRIEVLIDGGFRRGTDVLKALALGARGVLIGRPICWGLAAAGAEGVAKVLGIMTGELSRSMMLTNVPHLKNVSRDTIVFDPAVL
ncbi:MAG: alpha-hydroxy-acid oxidizing protein [Desulfobacterales bacterium]|nr:alpha-hydroxy-acid oxidizing protein [Desulfobacterales bacterium]